MSLDFDLSFQELGIDELARAIEVVARNTNLQGLNLSGCPLPFGAVGHISSALHRNSALKTLALQSCVLDPLDVRDLASTLSTPACPLTSLDLSDTHLSPPSIELLSATLRQTTTLTSLNLAYNDLHFIGVRFLVLSLPLNSSLLHLDLSWNDIGSKGSIFIAEALLANSTLRTLSLAGNQIDDDGLAHLTLRLNSHYSLTSLDLSYNIFTFNGVGELFRTLHGSRMPTYREVKLNATHLDPEILPQIAQVLCTNSTLKTLSLARTKPILSSSPVVRPFGNDGLKTISTALLSNFCLSSLDLSGHAIGTEGVDHLCSLLSSNHTLTSINLSNNNIDREGALMLADVLHANKSLTDLDLRQNPVGDRFGREFLVALRWNPLIVRLALPETTPRKYLKHIAAELAVNQALSSCPSEMFDRLAPLEDGLLDLRNLGLTPKLCDLMLPQVFQRYARDILCVDLTQNPRLNRIPRSIGYLSHKIRTRILFDNTDAWDALEKQYLASASKDDGALILLMKAYLQYGNNPASHRLMESHYDKSSNALLLSHLNLDNEQARRLPFHHPKWRALKRIQLTGNPLLSQIPPNLGFLDPNVTESIEIDAACLLPSVRSHAKSAQTIIQYAKALLEGRLVALNLVKLLVVGKAGVGKTSLVRSLCNQSYNPAIASTDGIDLGYFSMGGIRFTTWDFGGQKIYRFTHQLFLANNAIYLMLFKLTHSLANNIKELKFWFNSILSRARDPQILLVGTHADKAALVSPTHAEEISSAIISALSKEYGAVISSASAGRTVFHVSLVAGDEVSVDDLRQRLLEVSHIVNIQAPDNYGEAERHLQSLNVFPPYVNLGTVVADLQIKLVLTATQVQDVLTVLDDIGVICVFRSSLMEGGGLVVLRPQWIALLLATIVTTKHRFINPDTGVITHSTLTAHLWRDKNLFPSESHADMLNLLIELHVLFPLKFPGERSYFIPCMLHEEPSDMRIHLPARLVATSPFHLRRKFTLIRSTVPIAVIPPLMIEFVTHGELRTCWQQGCLVRFRPELTDSEVWLQLWCSESNVIEVAIWGSSIRLVSKWIRLTSSMLALQLEEFYHVPYKISVPCPHCTYPPSFFDLDDIQLCIMRQHEGIVCRPFSAHQVRIDTLVPDLLFAELRIDGLLFDFDSFTEVDVLGQGAFGKVLKMTRPDCQASSSSSSATPISYAVKLLQSVSNERTIPPKQVLEAFHSFKHEVYLASSLVHPNIVRLQGICLHPLAMVMEIVGGGDLYSQLNDPIGLRQTIFAGAKTISDAITAHNLARVNSRTFYFVYENRHKLHPRDVSIFQTKIRECLQEQDPETLPMAEINDSSVCAWIDHSYRVNTVSPARRELENRSLSTWYQLSEEVLQPISPPPLLPLDKIANCALPRAREGFTFWKNHCPSPEMESQINTVQEQYEDALLQCYVSSNSRAACLSLKNILDSIETLSSNHSLLIAPLSYPTMLRIACDIARGAAYLHELTPPMVHRDLKSPNIFMTRSFLSFRSNFNPDDDQPLAKVGDFGLSLISGAQLQIVDRDHADPLLNLNPTWAAPELLRAERYTIAVDVYSMGIILWELLTRAHPFSEIPLDFLKTQVCEGARPKIPSELSSVPENAPLIDLMERCWQDSSGARPTMRHVLHTLVEISSAHCPQLTAHLNASPVPHLQQEPAPSEHSELPSVMVQAFSITPPPPSTTPSVTLISNLLVSPSSSSFQSCQICAQPFGLIFNRPKKCATCKLFVCARCGSLCCALRSAFSPPEFDAEDHVTCIVAPTGEREPFWVGYRSGRVAVISPLVDPAKQGLPSLCCCNPHESHSLRVNAVVYTESQAEDGSVWTASEDGSLHVWSVKVKSADEILEFNTYKARLCFSHIHQSNRSEIFWVELENGFLRWFKQRYARTPVGSIKLDASSMQLLISPDFGQLFLATTTNIYFLSMPATSASASAGVNPMKEWYRRLKNVLVISERNLGVLRLASYHQPGVGMMALASVDSTTWSVGTDFLLCEWTLTSSEDEHGLDRSMRLRRLRCLQLDPSVLPARMQTIGGLVRASARSLWVALGNRWLVIDLAHTALSHELSEPPPHLEKIVCFVLIRHQERREIWSIDYQGKLCICTLTDPSDPTEIVKPDSHSIIGHASDDPVDRVYCISQVSDTQIWLGTSSGKIVAWDIATRGLLCHELQPLRADHPLVHTKSVSALFGFDPASQVRSSVAWSLSRDRTLRRFNW